MTTTAPPESNEGQAVEDLAGRIFAAGVSALELATIYLGQQLGLYRTLAEAGPTTLSELAKAANIDQRYAREWLQSQAISGFVAIDSDDLDTARFTLAPGAHEVLVDEESPVYLAPLGQCLVASAKVMPDLVSAFRSGDGVPYPAYGPDAVSAQAALNRPAFMYDLTSSWIPAIPASAAKLSDPSTPRRIADIGCGVGWSSIAMAKAYPNVHIDGFDADEASIAEARRNALEHGVADRITFMVSDLSGVDNPGAYDLAFFFECLHDMSHPDLVLGNARESLKSDGEVIIMDERTDDTLVAPTDDLAQRFFGAVSVAWCLPQGRTSVDAHPVGTVMRTSDLQEIASAAGFPTVEVLPIDHPMFRFYRLAA